VRLCLEGSRNDFAILLQTRKSERRNAQDESNHGRYSSAIFWRAFFDIDRSTIFAILNTLTTFVILMVQFRSLIKEMEEFKTS
jgi:hypothetical protein